MTTCVFDTALLFTRRHSEMSMQMTRGLAQSYFQLGEGFLSGSLNCGFHCWLWHLKDKSWAMRNSWNRHNRSTWKKCYTTAPANEKTYSVKNPKHVFVFFQQIQKQNSLWKNSFTFNTWMETTQQNCQLAIYSTQPVTTQNWIMKVSSQWSNKLWIQKEWVKIRHWAASPQLLPYYFPLIYFDLRSAKGSMTGDPKSLTALQAEAANVLDFHCSLEQRSWSEACCKWTGCFLSETKRMKEFQPLIYAMVRAYHPFKVALTDGQKLKLWQTFPKKKQL